MNPSKNFFLYSAIIFCAGLVLFLYWLTSLEPQKITAEHSTVIVSHSPPTPQIFGTLDNPKAAPTPELNNKAAVDNSPGIDLGQNNEVTNSYAAIRVQLVDLLNEPIPNGSIKMQGKTITVKNGIGSIEYSDLIEPATIVVSSTGYQSATRTIQTPIQEDIVIPLDYLCDFQLTVFQDKEKKIPADNAEIVLYHAKDAPRPIPSRMMASLSMQHAYPYEIVWHDGELIVNRSTLLRDLNTQFGEIPLGTKYFDPLPGDRITAIGECTWNRLFLKQESKDFVSNKIRILDTLAFIMHKGRWYEQVELQRGKQYGSTIVNFQDPKSFTIQKRGQTDANGKYRFNALSPGLYFVQAKLGESRSVMKVLHPAREQYSLVLHNKSTLTVETFLKMEPSVDFFNKYLENTQVKLHSLWEQGIYMTEAKTDRTGRCTFPNLPYGKYKLVAFPINKDEFQIETLTQEIVVNEPLQKITLEFEWENQYSIEGVVLRADNQEPVPNYPVRIVDKVPGGSSTFGKTTHTGEQGRFEFQQLPPGEYYVSHIIDSLKTPNYFPFNENREDEFDWSFIMNQDIRSSSNPSWGEHISVQDSETSHVTLYVVPILKTYVSGRVQTPQHQPVSDALINMFIRKQGRPLFTLEPNPVTDKEGRFNLTVLSKGDPAKIEQKIKGRVVSTIGEVIPPQWIEDPNTSSKIITEKQVIPFAEGETEFDFQIGDNINNLNIIIDDEKYNVLEGRIRGEDGGIPQNIQVLMHQGNYKYPVDVNSDGSFRLKIFRDDFIRLEILHASRPDEGTDSGWVSYLADKISTIHFSENNYMYLDISLQVEGDIQGTIVDADQNPRTNTYLVARGTSGEEFKAYAGLDGSFRLKVAKKDLYSLGIYDQEKNKYHPLENYQQIIPNDTPLQIVIGRETPQ
jgi:hypothetical protein